MSKSSSSVCGEEEVVMAVRERRMAVMKGMRIVMERRSMTGQRWWDWVTVVGWGGTTQSESESCIYARPLRENPILLFEDVKPNTKLIKLQV